jgi:hypothetical protein
LIFASIQHLVNAGNGVKDAYDSMLTIFTEFQSFLSRFAIYNQGEIHTRLKAVIIKILVALIKACGLAAEMMKRGKVFSFFKAVINGDDTRAKDALGELLRLRDEEHGMVLALTYDSSQRGIQTTTTYGERNIEVTTNYGERNMEVTADYGEMNIALTTEYGEKTTTGIINLSKEFRDMKKQDKDELERRQFDRLRTILGPSPASNKVFNDIKSKFVLGTGNWIRTMPAYTPWYDQKIPVVWLWGLPGAGKTYLSFNVIQHLTTEHPQNVQNAKRVSVAYYFCKANHPDLQSLPKALKTICFQICQNDQVYAKYINDLRMYPEDVRGIWQVLFVDFFSRTDIGNVAYILIDGLDELLGEDRTAFLESLLDLLDEDNFSQMPRLQVMVIGRPGLGVDIGDDFRVPMISMSAERSAQDINDYIQHFLTTDKVLRRVSQGTKKEITSSLLRGADAGFEWVYQVLKAVANERREDKMLETLKKSPRSYSKLIQHTLELFEENEADDLNTMLTWVFGARRTLMLGELDSILQLKNDCATVYLEGQLRTRYASLFTLLREDGRTTEDLQVDHSHSNELEDDEAVAEDITGLLARGLDIESDPLTTEVDLPRSIRDFFKEANGKHATVGIDVQESEITITKALLSMICDDQKWQEWNKNTLATYASRYWQDHLTSINLPLVPDDDKRIIGNYLILMLREDAVALRWGGKTGAIADNFIYKRENVDAIQKWFSDEAVTMDYSEEYKSWIASLYPATEADLMDNAIRAFAKECLQKITWSPEIVFKGLQAHVLLVCVPLYARFLTCANINHRRIAEKREVALQKLVLL